MLSGHQTRNEGEQRSRTATNGRTPWTARGTSSESTPKALWVIGGVVAGLFLVAAVMGLLTSRESADAVRELARQTRTLNSDVDALRESTVRMRKTDATDVEWLNQRLAKMELSLAKAEQERKASADRVSDKQLFDAAQRLLTANLPQKSNEAPRPAELLIRAADLAAKDIASHVGDQVKLTDEQKEQLTDIVSGSVGEANALAREFLGDADEEQLKKTMDGLLDGRIQRQEQVKKLLNGMSDDQRQAFDRIGERWANAGANVFEDRAVLDKQQAAAVRNAVQQAVAQGTALARDVAGGGITRQAAEARAQAIKDQFQTTTDGVRLTDEQKRRVEKLQKAITGPGLLEGKPPTLDKKVIDEVF